MTDIEDTIIDKLLKKSDRSNTYSVLPLHFCWGSCIFSAICIIYDIYKH